MKIFLKIKKRAQFLLICLSLVGGLSLIPSAVVLADVNTPYHCGSGAGEVPTSIDIGCTGTVQNPILDMLFAFIRLLSDGIGLLVIGSVIVAGIQFTTSRGDPQATGAAINRIRATLIALLLYLFAYGLLNWLVPGGFLHT